MVFWWTGSVIDRRWRWYSVWDVVRWHAFRWADWYVIVADQIYINTVFILWSQYEQYNLDWYLPCQTGGRFICKWVVYYILFYTFCLFWCNILLTVAYLLDVWWSWWYFIGCGGVDGIILVVMFIKMWCIKCAIIIVSWLAIWPTSMTNHTAMTKLL
jgi:hypothetical protein